MKENILGFAVSNYNYEELIKNIFIDIENNEQHFLVNINPLIIMNYYQNEKYKQIFNQEKYQIPDGIGIVLASKMKKKIIKNRITGIDLMEKICETASKKGKSIYLCGAKPGVAIKASNVLIKKYHNLHIAGVCDGYITEEEMIKQINLVKPDILFVALGSPKQEEFIVKNQKNLQVKILMPVGGSFDVISGNIKRASKKIQKLHLEWLYRMLKEPGRIKQNIVLIKFILLVMFNKK
ncbi:MAG: WecB/TagA/CpsF family glycosyltransferase [Bacilli bacterium]|nr:WecB/TagA/CpsF family glycosyltransferase [Bacilli bacterium]